MNFFEHKGIIKWISLIKNAEYYPIEKGQPYHTYIASYYRRAFVTKAKMLSSLKVA